MNLYRSFGNLLETWVAEGLPQQDEWLGGGYGNSIAASPHMGKLSLRSESEDSGVETASSDVSLGSPRHSGIDAVATGRDEDRLSPASTSQSSVISASSSSQSLCPGKDQMPGCLKVEQALRRSDPRWQSPRNVPESGAADDDAALGQHVSTAAAGQRSESFGPRKTGGPLAPSKQTSELCRRALKTEGNGEEEMGLSPGLRYLEQVCRMLEEIARLRMYNTVLQMEMDALQEHRARQAPDPHQCDHKVAEEDFSSCQRLESAGVEHISSEPRQQSYYAQRDFRQRSASDTKILTGHLRKLKPNSRGQHASTNDLFDKAEDHEEQEVKKGDNKRKTWRIKMGSVGRRERPLKSDSEINSQQVHSSEKENRHRLSQLFRRRRRTLPA